MKKEIMDILCCPRCKSSLELTTEVEKDDEIIVGSLTCLKCKKTFPITDGIPNFIDESS